MIDSRNEYTMTKSDTILIRPGHTVSCQWNLYNIITDYFKQNVVSLDATKLTPNPDIETIIPQKRNCYFSYEHPPHHQLEAHRRYSHVGG